MRQLNELQAANWQVSINGYGYVEDGFDDINQCIRIILTTKKGDDPFRPEFGCDLWQYVDRPVNTAAAAMVQTILEALSIWETRITVQRVTYRIVEHNIIFEISWLLNRLGGGGVMEFNLLRAFAQPPKPRPVPPAKGNTLLAAEDGAYILTESGDYIII
jgi:phage baseplate assembly protein W